MSFKHFILKNISIENSRFVNLKCEIYVKHNLIEYEINVESLFVQGTEAKHK